MPSVPSSKDAVMGPVCPHSAKLHNHTNREAKLREGPIPLIAVDKATVGDREEANRAIQINTKNTSPERKWIRPDLPSRCTWSLGASTADSPHTQVPRLAGVHVSSFLLYLQGACISYYFVCLNQRIAVQ